MSRMTTTALAALALTTAIAGAAHARVEHNVMLLNNLQDRNARISIVNQNINGNARLGSSTTIKTLVFVMPATSDSTAHYRLRVTSTGQYSTTDTRTECDTVVIAAWSQARNRMSCSGATQVGRCSVRVMARTDVNRCDYSIVLQ